jgi:hypothetical protein
MRAYGIRFKVDNAKHFDRLRGLFYELKKDKDRKTFRSPDKWEQFFPDELKINFKWPTSDIQKMWSANKTSTPILFDDPFDYLGVVWDFYRVFDSIRSGEYSLIACEMTGPTSAEMQIDPTTYPYGGVGPLIALAEAFGFHVLGVNEFGMYQSRENMKAAPRTQIPQAKPAPKPKWKLWRRAVTS